MVGTGSFAVDTVSDDLFTYYICIPEVSLTEGQDGHQSHAKGLQMGFGWLDKESRHLLFSKAI